MDEILDLDFMNYVNHTVPQDFLADQKYIVSVSVPYSEVSKEVRGKCII